ncbi:unnamed protein product [Bemisia tabaci]|uniref:Uncharacterized protein n=1 Tax=Bemisia tabaci TaxID=7038 RepID=A0A9P0EZ54_BEMTA|nr:unnamed protein product [Bemisia tabaci]
MCRCNCRHYTDYLLHGRTYGLFWDPTYNSHMSSDCPFHRIVTNDDDVNSDKFTLKNGYGKAIELGPPIHDDPSSLDNPSAPAPDSPNASSPSLQKVSAPGSPKVSDSPEASPPGSPRASPGSANGSNRSSPRRSKSPQRNRRQPSQNGNDEQHLNHDMLTPRRAVPANATSVRGI